MKEENKFKTYISRFPHFSEDSFAMAAPLLQNRQIKKGELILEQGRQCRDINFVVSGIFRVFYLRDGVEITTCFCNENRFATSYQSLINDVPSDLSIQAVEDSEIVSIQYDGLQKLYDHDLFWQQIGRMVTEQEYLASECYRRLINDKSAKQRYLEILETEPELLQRVSLADLATYLQVRPETISRIRKEISSS